MKNSTVINSYNSLETLDSYEIGKVYSFYLHNSSINKLTKISKSDYAKYVKRLEKAITQHPEIESSKGQYFNYTRAVGIVIDKVQSNSPKRADYIVVMFKTKSNECIINKYSVNTCDVFTNDKDIVTPAAAIKFEKIK